MAEFYLAFNAFDVHELACHFVARHAGVYDRQGLQPQLVDATFLADDALPPRSLRAACGAALAAWLRGADTRVVFIAARRPMFWLYGAPGLGALDDLQGKVVAGYPEYAPPAAFFREIWSRHGLAASRVTVMPARDDLARLGLLRDGSVAAALVSSAIPPAVAGELGLHPLAFVGDEICTATTGLAARPSFCEQDPGLVAAVCACYQEALTIIHGDAALLNQALQASQGPLADKAASLAPVLRNCYTRDGRVPAEELQPGAASLARAMAIDSFRPVAQLYDFSYLPA